MHRRHTLRVPSIGAGFRHQSTDAAARLIGKVASKGTNAKQPPSAECVYRAERYWLVLDCLLAIKSSGSPGTQNALRFVEPGEASHPALNHHPLSIDMSRVTMPRIKHGGLMYGPNIDRNQNRERWSAR